ncbi:hypothetical protein ACLEBP_12410 [Escherichia coli]
MGASFEDFQQDLLNLSKRAWLARKPISQGGLLKYVHGGEYHASTRTWCARCNRRYRAASIATIRNTRSWLMSVGNGTLPRSAGNYAG